jgi:hypothetical protein
MLDPAAVAGSRASIQRERYAITRAESSRLGVNAGWLEQFATDDVRAAAGLSGAFGEVGGGWPATDIASPATQALSKVDALFEGADRGPERALDLVIEGDEEPFGKEPWPTRHSKPISPACSVSQRVP